MCSAAHKGLTAAFGVLVALAACGEDAPGADGTAVEKTPAIARAARRAFDGAPPVIGHAPMGAACTACHNAHGMEVPGTGFAPPSPHANTAPPSAMSRCQQCHIYATTDAVFRPNAFAGLKQDLRRGERLNKLAPPVVPHQILLRENCAACHTGQAAREEIRCTHPERTRCRQCHVPAVASGEFQRPG
ncbi:MAG: hypothetical protein AAF628_12135 [Planctomycetota bacterium]